MARKLDFKIDQGTDSELSFYPFPGHDVDLTGYQAAMQVRAGFRAERLIDTLTTLNGRLVIDAGKSKITAHFPHNNTVQYPEKGCVYDIELVSDGAKVYRVLEGKIYVSPEVTRVKLPSS